MVDETCAREIFKEIVNDSRSARAYGSAALEIVSVATGNLEAYMTPRLQPWDFAGGLVILNEVDGQASNLLGEPLTIGGPNSVLVGIVVFIERSSMYI